MFLMFPNLPNGFETGKIKNVILNHLCWYGIADDVSESKLLVVCEFVMLCILGFFVIKWMFKLYEHEFTYI